MRRSISHQISRVFLIIMVMCLGLSLCMNQLFLEKYYIRNKKAIIMDAYQKVSDAARSDVYNSEEFEDELNDICTNNNISVFVMDANSQVKYVSRNGGRELEIQLLGYLFGMSTNQVEILEQGQDYVIQRVLDEEEYLEIYGRLSTGISFLMRTPVESIRESVSVANRFFIYAGIVMIIVGAVAIDLLARYITRPIRELSDISERMVHLDFEAKYSGVAHNELDLLGDNMNKLSESLKNSIGELKTANNELKRDIEKKNEMEEMRKEFIANVSHELKTPIALIQGYAEGLSEDVNDDPESRKYYSDVIVDEASKMNQMVQKLLTLNQLEFGDDVISMERFDIVELIHSLIQSASILTKNQDIVVLMEETEPVYVWADEYKIEEVVMNFFTNAVNHCEGERKIVISLTDEVDKIRIAVFNTGKPIPSEAIPKLWDKFYKVDKARTRAYGGSGVGLSIVKAIMESMNQQYGVENFDNGVQFWFELEKCKEEM